MIRELKVQCAYHSPLVYDCKPAIADSIGILRSNRKYDIPIISTVSGELGSDSDYICGKYWADNVGEPVLLCQAVEKAFVDDVQNVFIEVGPRQVLKAHLDNILPEPNKLCLPSMNANQDDSLMFSSLKELYQIGYEINWKSFHEEKQVPVEIPKYAFQKKRHLHFGNKVKSLIAGSLNQVDTSHMFICRNGSNEQDSFKVCIDKSNTPFVYDHFLSDTMLVPGATYVDAAFFIGLATMNKQISDIAISIEFENFVTPSAEEKLEIEAQCKKEKEGHRFVYNHGGRQVSSGFATFRTSLSKQPINIENLKRNLSIVRNKEDTYSCLQKLQFKYGPSLSLIDRSWSKDKQCLVELTVPESVEVDFTKTMIHPAVVDAIFQTFGILSENETSAVPRGAEKIVVNGQCKRKMFAYASEVKATAAKKYYNALLLSESGQVLAEVERFYTKSLSNTVTGVDTLKYSVECTEINGSIKPNILQADIVTYNLNASTISSKLKSSLANCRFIDQLSGVSKLKPKSIVLFACEQNLMDSHILNSSIQLYRALRNQLLLLSQESIHCPVSIVTENCFCAPGRDEKNANLFGSELWGMVRSVRYESTLPDIRLIDIGSVEFDGSLLLSVVCDRDLQNAELFITGHQIHSFSVQPKSAVSVEHTVGVVLDRFRNATLVSENVNVVTSPHFKLAQTNKDSSKKVDVPVEIQTIILHNKTIFPSTECDSDVYDNIFSTTQGSTAFVAALEGRGQCFEKGTLNEVIFCYPTRVQTPLTHIPRECIISKQDFPHNADGILPILCILFRLSRAVPVSSRVLIMKNAAESSFVVTFMKTLLHDNGCSLSVQDSDEDYNVLQNKPTVMLILDSLRLDDLTQHISLNRSIEKIVSLSYCLPNNSAAILQLANYNIEVETLNCSEMFTRHFLIETVPKVVQIVKRQKDIKLSTNNKMLIWNIPMSSMSIKEPSLSLRLAESDLFQKQSCYIVIGGLTGLGKLLLKFIAECGAGYVANVSRRLPTNEQYQELNKIELQSLCKIHCIQADVSAIDSLRKGLNDLKNKLKGIPIRGVFHGAGVLSDSLLENQTDESVKSVLSPKVQGSWNLHLCTKDLPLDFFVMHSSIVSILGNRGQSNYAAGNSFLDSLAAYRRAHGLCGQSINWGALAVGMAAENKTVEKNLKQLGHRLLTEEEIKQCFVDALLDNSVQVCFANVHWEIVLNSIPNMHQREKFIGIKTMNRQQISTSQETGQKELLNIRSLSSEEKGKCIRTLVRETVCDVFVASQETLDDTTSFASLGVDSMSAMSLVNSIHDVLKIRIPMMKVLSETACVQSITVFCLQSLETEVNGENMQNNATSTDSILDGKMSFMQMFTFEEYLKQTEDHSLIHLIDIEIDGLVLSITDWKKLFSLVLEAQPELSVNVVVANNGIAELKYTASEHAIVEEIRLDNLENVDAIHDDPRLFLKFDLEKEIPVKFQVAVGDNRSVVRLAVHKCVSDLTSIGLIANEMAKAIQIINGNTEIIQKRRSVDVVVALKNALKPKWRQAELFWSKYLVQEIKPTSISLNLKDPLSENFCLETRTLSKDKILKLRSYINKHGLTFSQMMASLYQLLLHIETSEEKVVITTAVDMRVHVPELSHTAARCINVVPLISVANQINKVSSFLQENGIKITEVLDNSYFPTDLILANIKSEKLRKHVGRHYIVMDRMDDINDVLKFDEKYKVKVKGLWTKRTRKETVLYVNYDIKMNEVVLELGYDSFICGRNGGRRMLDKICAIIDMIPEFEIITLGDLMTSNRVATENSFSVETLTTTTPKTTDMQLQTKSNIHSNILTTRTHATCEGPDGLLSHENDLQLKYRYDLKPGELRNGNEKVYHESKEESDIFEGKNLNYHCYHV